MERRAEESGKRGFSSKIARLYIHPGQPPPSAQLSAAGLTRVPLCLSPSCMTAPSAESSLMLSPVPRPTRARTHRMPCALRLRLPSPSLSVSLSPHTHTITHQRTELSDTRTHALTHHIHTQIDKTHGSVTASTRSSGSCSRRGRPLRGSACTRTQSSAAGRSRRCTSSARRPGGAGGPSPRR